VGRGYHRVGTDKHRLDGTVIARHGETAGMQPPEAEADADAETDPSVGFDWLTLDDSETVVWADNPHELSLVPPLLVGIPLSFVLVGIPIVVGAYLSHRNTDYVVTTAALYRKTGVLSRNVQRIEFDKVQDTSYRQSFFGSQFGYGTVDVSTAGGTGIEMSFANVADPQALQRRINERIRSGRGKGEDREKAAVLDDILTELRAIRAAVEGGGGGVDTEAEKSNLEDDASVGREGEEGHR
jgi:membrane protein YdbS with pleckstrin-like domain